MKVDIIMPTHNPGAFILEALESCMIQTHKNFKVTVVDDCSNKDLSYLKKRFPKIDLIKTPKNMGPAGARNYGIRHTNSELISFLDDDDVMDMNKLTWSVNEFKKDSGIGMTCGNYKILVHGRLRQPFYKQAIKVDWNALMKINYVASGSTTVKRSVLNDVGLFDERFWIGEDAELWLRISEKYKISYIHKVLYYYRIIPGSDSLTQRKDINKDLIPNIELMRKESRERMNKK